MDINSDKHPLERESEYAGFWIRFGAYLLDSIILGIPFTILAFVVFYITLGSSGELDTFTNPEYTGENMTDQQAFSFFGGFLIIMVLNLIITVGYFAGMHSSKWQASIGKKLLGLIVTDLNGRRISFWRGLGRYFAMYLSSILLIGYIMAAFTKKKQSLHDLIAETIVFKLKE